MLLFKNSFKLFYSSLETSYSNVLGIRMKFKIILPIIRFILFTTYRIFSSFMMDSLPSFKRATEHFGHYKAMLINLASFICHRVIRQIKFDIAMAGKFSMEWLSSAFLFPSKPPSTMITTARKKLAFCHPAIKIMHRNPSIVATTATGNKHGKSIFSATHNLVANRIPVDNRTGHYRL